MNRIALALASALVLCACPKSAPTAQLSGSDGEKMEMIASKLEEYRTRTGGDCSETCSIKKKVCDLSDTACEIAGKNADRNDYQQRCIAAQEDCARYSESCSTCQK